MSESSNGTNARRRRRSQKSRQTEQEILNQAKIIFAERGHEETTTKDIAQAAGVAEGTVFRYFENKLGLLNGVMNDIYARLQAGVDEIVAKEADSFRRLRALLAYHLRVVDEEWQLFRIIGQYGRYGHSEFADNFYQLNKKYAKVFVMTLEDLKASGRIRATTPTPLIRDTLFGSIEHFAIRHFASQRPYERDEYLNHLLDLVLFGCGSRM